MVSPGAFRTEFLGKDSIRRIGGRRAYREVDDALARWAANDGKQLCDSALAVALRLADADEPPFDLLLGQDALDRADRMAIDIRAWRAILAGLRETFTVHCCTGGHAATGPPPRAADPCA